MIGVKIMKLYKELKTYTSDTGEEKKATNFYILLDNGSRVYIKPKFDSEKDFYMLLAVATMVDTHE